MADLMLKKRRNSWVSELIELMLSVRYYYNTVISKLLMAQNSGFHVYLLCNKSKAFIGPVTFICLSQNRVERLSPSSVVAGCVARYNKCSYVYLNKAKPTQLVVLFLK